MDAETQLAGYFAKYDAPVAKLGKALRTKLRARLPGLYELVYLYESKNSLVVAYSPIDKGHAGVCSIALEPSGVKLYFGRGAELAHADPKELLQGRGATVRHVVMESAKDLDRPEIAALFDAALKLAKVTLDPAAKGAIVFKVEEQKQRAQRATKKKATKKKAAKKATKMAVTRAKPARRSTKKRP